MSAGLAPHNNLCFNILQAFSRLREYAHWFRLLRYLRFRQRRIRTAKTATVGDAYSSMDGQNVTVKAVEHSWERRKSPKDIASRAAQTTASNTWKVAQTETTAGSGKSPLCSGASQFSADYAAVQLLATGHSESTLYAKE